MSARSKTFSMFSMQLQAFFLVADDIMDNSITRRGQPCWYRVSEVRCIQSSIEDSSLMCQGESKRSRMYNASCACKAILCYKQVGLVACNDYIILESCIYRILKKHFGQKPYYGLLLDFFHEVSNLPSLPPACLDLLAGHSQIWMLRISFLYWRASMCIAVCICLVLT